MMQKARDYRQRLMRRLDAFTTKHPLIGPIFWILAVQYFVVQLVVAAAWPKPFDWKDNYISDLGAVATCGEFSGRYVCSPLADIMNLSFMLFGVTIAAGAVLIYTEFKRTRVSKISFLLMMLSGFGTVMVGAFPEDTMSTLHFIGAVMALLLGNVAIVGMALSLKGIRNIFRGYSFVSGGFSVVAFALFASGVTLGLGEGGMERAVSYLFTIWMTAFGVYMTFVRLRPKARQLKS